MDLEDFRLRYCIGIKLPWLIEQAEWRPGEKATLCFDGDGGDGGDGGDDGDDDDDDDDDDDAEVEAETQADWQEYMDSINQQDVVNGVVDPATGNIVDPATGLEITNDPSAPAAGPTGGTVDPAMEAMAMGSVTDIPGATTTGAATTGSFGGFGAGYGDIPADQAAAANAGVNAAGFSASQGTGTQDDPFALDPIEVQGPAVAGVAGTPGAELGVGRDDITAAMLDQRDQEQQAALSPTGFSSFQNFDTPVNDINAFSVAPGVQTAQVQDPFGNYVGGKAQDQLPSGSPIGSPQANYGMGVGFGFDATQPGVPSNPSLSPNAVVAQNFGQSTTAAPFDFGLATSNTAAKGDLQSAAMPDPNAGVPVSQDPAYAAAIQELASQMSASQPTQASVAAAMAAMGIGAPPGNTQTAQSTPGSVPTTSITPGQTPGSYNEVPTSATQPGPAISQVTAGVAAPAISSNPLGLGALQPDVLSHQEVSIPSGNIQGTPDPNAPQQPDQGREPNAVEKATDQLVGFLGGQQGQSGFDPGVDDGSSGDLASRGGQQFALGGSALPGAVAPTPQSVNPIITPQPTPRNSVNPTPYTPAAPGLPPGVDPGSLQFDVAPERGYPGRPPTRSLRDQIAAAMLAQSRDRLV